jgi:hypothetical protein
MTLTEMRVEELKAVAESIGIKVSARKIMKT